MAQQNQNSATMPHPLRARIVKAFTLVELLVVIAIIGTLVGLLLLLGMAPTITLWVARIRPPHFGSITGRDLFRRGDGSPGCRTKAHRVEPTDALALVLVALPMTPSEPVTGNFRAPIVFNISKGLAQQIVNRDEQYSLREPMDLAAYPVVEDGLRLT